MNLVARVGTDFALFFTSLIGAILLTRYILDRVIAYAPALRAAQHAAGGRSGERRQAPTYTRWAQHQIVAVVFVSLYNR